MIIPEIKSFYDVKNIEENTEVFKTLFNSNSVIIEQIVSKGYNNPSDYWYDQENDEWVFLLQGEAEMEWENKQKSLLHAGNYLFIPSHFKHRIASTSSNPPCIWLAIHIKTS